MPAKNKWVHSMTIDIVTIDKFLQAVPIRMIDEFATQYNQRVKILDVDGGVSHGEYIRRTAYLKKGFYKKVAKELLRHLVEFKLDKATKSQEVVELMAIESLTHFGQPTHAVLVDNYLCLLNPQEFVMYLKFDMFGRLYGTIGCFSKPGNLKTDATSGKVLFDIPNLDPAEITRIDATLKETKKALREAKDGKA